MYLLRSLPLAGFALLLATADSAVAAEKPALGFTVDKAARTLTIPASIAPRKLPGFAQVYPIEVIATWPYRKAPPGGQKAHETVVNIDFALKPSQIHKALEGLGLKAGKPILGEGTPTGPEVEILLELPGADGAAKRVPIEETLVDKATGKSLPRVKWIFTGSDLKFPDPEKDDKEYGADLYGTFISLMPVTNDTVFQSGIPIKQEKSLKLETNEKVLPKVGTPVKLIIQVK